MDPLSLPLIRVSERPSGEKQSHPSKDQGCMKVSSCSRVTASRTFVLPGISTAMNLLHDDHTAVPMTPYFTVAKFGPHEIGNPRTTLARGWMYCLYSLCTIDVCGDKKIAE